MKLIFIMEKGLYSGKSRNIFTIVNLTGPLNFPDVSVSRVIGNVRVNWSKTN